MVKNLREKRSTGGAGGVNDRPRRSTLLDQQTADNSNMSSTSTKKTRSSIVRRTKDQPSDFEDTDPGDNVKYSEKSNESNFDDDEDTRGENFMVIVSYKIKLIFLV